MWAYVKDGEVVQMNQSQTALVIRGVNFPAKYSYEWTTEEKKAYGVYQVIIDESNIKNRQFYINGAATTVYDSDSDTVTCSYATATAKPLTDSIDEDDGKVNREGLTNRHKRKTNVSANSRLLQTDWYATRKADTGKAIPSNVSTYRAAVRTKAEEVHTAIDNADTVEKLMAVYPIAWPEPVL